MLTNRLLASALLSSMGMAAAGIHGVEVVEAQHHRHTANTASGRVARPRGRNHGHGHAAIQRMARKRRNIKANRRAQKRAGR